MSDRMNVFSEEAIAQLAEEYETILPKRDQQIIAFFSHEFADERASEFAHHGFMRRLKMLSHCIDRIFHLLPPEMQVIPDSEDIADAQMALHAFIINVYGCVDNLAWVLVHERQIRKEDGTPIPNSWVGLGRDNAHVRDTLSENFQNYLVSIDGWFDNLENYRHSLVVRI